MADDERSAGPERARWPRLAGVPHPRLRPLLPRGYAGFVEQSAPRHLVIPATVAVPLIVKIRDSDRRPPQFTMGVRGRHAVVDGACAPSYLEVWLAPLAAYTLLGTPIRELRGQTVDLRELLGAPVRRGAERIREASSWDQRYAIMDEILLGRLDSGPRAAPEVGEAWRILRRTAGTERIGRIAHQVGWSHKHLISKFTEQVGLAPKAAARLVRFEHLLSRLAEPRRPGWGQLAAEAGYADQSHLIREFREVTGSTPTDFLRRTSKSHDRGHRARGNTS